MPLNSGTEAEAMTTFVYETAWYMNNEIYQADQ